MSVRTTTTDEKTNFTFKMDKSARDQFDLLCGTIGISMSAAMNAMVKQAVKDQRLSFYVQDKNGLTPAETAGLLCRISDVRLGKAGRHDLIEDEL